MVDQSIGHGDLYTQTTQGRGMPRETWVGIQSFISAMEGAQ